MEELPLLFTASQVPVVELPLFTASKYPKWLEERHKLEYINLEKRVVRHANKVRFWCDIDLAWCDESLKQVLDVQELQTT